MIRICSVVLLSVIFLSFVECSFVNPYPRFKEHLLSESDDVGVPLLLTPYLENGQIEKAKSLASVSLPTESPVTSYSGFFTVNKTANSNMFFWFFKARNSPETAPLMIWLQGGPGASSMFGLLTENGPFFVDQNMKLNDRPYSWHIGHNIIYFDNPVGTGFSFSDFDGYSRNEVDVGINLYEALTQFYVMFPEMRPNPLYVSGESYGGKYVPALGYKIHQMNPKIPEAKRINLKGLAIGNGLSDPLHQLKYGDYLYQIGLIDANGRDLFHKYEKEGVDAIEKHDFNRAFEVFDELINMDQTPSGSLFKNLTALPSYFNFVRTGIDDNDGSDVMGKFLQLPSTRKAIHVGNATFHDIENTNYVEIYMKQDVMDTVAPWVSELLNNYRMCIYNGQLDIIVAYPLTVNYLYNLDFKDKEAYLKQPRYIWKVDNKVAGYVKEIGNIVEVMVRDAGHMVPFDQPKWALDMIMRFTNTKSFNNN